MDASKMMFVFFAINTVFVSLLCILLVVITVFIYRIFKKIESVVDSAKDAGIKATNAFGDVASTVKNESQDVVVGVSKLIQKILPKKDSTANQKD